MNIEQRYQSTGTVLAPYVVFISAGINYLQSTRDFGRNSQEQAFEGFGSFRLMRRLMRRYLVICNLHTNAECIYPLGPLDFPIFFNDEYYLNNLILNIMYSFQILFVLDQASSMFHMFLTFSWASNITQDHCIMLKNINLFYYICARM